jgi:hypothetical protein
MIVANCWSQNKPNYSCFAPDSEGHVIHYAVTVSADRKTIEFISEASTSSPRYRLTYLMTGGDALTLKFDVAPPGKPDSLSTYIEAKAKRK